MATTTPQVLSQFRKVRNYVWDVDSLTWVPEQQPATSGGAGGDVTIAGPLGQTTMSGSIPVTVASDQTPILVIAI